LSAHRGIIILAYSSAAVMTTTMPQGSAVFPRSHVGFDSITSQIEKKLLKRGFQFNVICVGMWNWPSEE
jgi:hypothetical protein